MHSLEGKVAIVTGASSGIGRATAKLFAREGAKVVIGARRQAELEALADEINRDGGQTVVLAGDIKHETFARALVELAVARFGGLDVAFNNAGTLGAMKRTPELSLSDWDEAIGVNLTGGFLCAKHQIPAMLARGGGSIVFTSTFIGYTVGLPSTAAYSSSKAGLIGLTKALASEFGHKGIRVNALVPGGTDTPMSRAFADTSETQTFVGDLHALKRMATPEEIAQSALYLASDASSFTTGSALLTDGGVSIVRA